MQASSSRLFLDDRALPCPQRACDCDRTSPYFRRSQIEMLRIFGLVMIRDAIYDSKQGGRRDNVAKMQICCLLDLLWYHKSLILLVGHMQDVTPRCRGLDGPLESFNGTKLHRKHQNATQHLWTVSAIFSRWRGLCTMPECYKIAYRGIPDSTKALLT